MSVNYIRINIVFTAGFVWQTYFTVKQFTYQILKETIFWLICTLSNILHKRCIETNRMIVVLMRFRQIVNKSLHSFPVFVNVAVNHCTSSDHLRDTRIKHYECVSVTLVIQHTTDMCHIVLCGVLESRIFPTLSYKRHDFREGLWRWNAMCVFWISVQLLPETLLLRRVLWNTTVNVHRFSCKVLIIILRF